MIKSIIVTNHLNESITLDLAAPEKSGFAVLSIEGLGPPKANINSTELATSDGSIYNSSRATSRNVVLSLKFLWNPTIEHMRQLSYKYFPVKKYITMTIETDQRTSVVVGYVESNEPNIFSSSEGTQISIVCPDAYIRSAAKGFATLSTVVGEFEFPFENEYPSTPVIEFGVITENSSQLINYTGDVETGLVLEITARGNVENLLIYSTVTRETITIDTAKLAYITGDIIIAGDQIIISTIKGSKFATLIRDGIGTNIIGALVSPVQWIRLIPGENILGYTADVGNDMVYIDVIYDIMYEGV